jgi:hypothetical protein
MMRKVYAVFGGLVLAAFLGFQWMGWTFSDDHEDHDSPPKSIRDNPGSYRAHYVGGK